MLFTWSLVLLWTVSAVFADDYGFGSTCSQANQKLSHGNYQLTSDCDAAFFCASNSTCAYKGCRTQDFPYGYPQGDTNLPPKCSEGQFCPDEGDACQAQLPVDSPCQLNRDDECAPPPNQSELAGPRNTNGSICLNFKCTWANATSGSTCVVENMPYIAYDQSGGTQFINIVSRDNCKNGLYCDATAHTCMSQLDTGASCTADKECRSVNCEINGKCGLAPSTTKHVATWVYVVVGVAIIGGVVAVLVTLFFLHGKSRDAIQAKRAQYWREQESYRNNILSMREQARASLPSLAWQNSGNSRGGPFRDSEYPPSESSQMFGTGKGSGLRNHFSDDDDDRNSMEEALVPSHDGDDYNSRKRKKSVRL